MSSLRNVMVAALLIVSCAGCAGSSLVKSPSALLKGRGAEPPKLPARILCLWEAAEGEGLDGRHGRGFAGQVLFFGYGSPQPMQVDGHVRIYLYDDFDPADTDPRPIHVFEFNSGGWNAHRATTTVGESYNVFLPYVKKHSQAAQCALKVEYVPEQGRPVVSPYTEIALPARGRAAKARRESVPQPAPQTESAKRLQSPGELDSLTIPVPSFRGDG